MSNGLVQLGSSDIVAGRPFTNPEGSAFDLTVLQYMVEILCRILLEPQAILNQPRPVILYLTEVGGRSHRIALSRPEALLQPDDLTVRGARARIASMAHGGRAFERSGTSSS